MPKPKCYKSAYAEKLKDPRWQRKRLEVLSRTDFKCENCGDGETTLHVHHSFYERGREPWEYDAETLRSYCADCHETWHEAKANAESALRLFCSRMTPDQMVEFSNRLAEFGPLPKRDFPIIQNCDTAFRDSMDASAWRKHVAESK